MTDEQKAALADLDRHIECGYPMSIASARTLKVMLSSPVLPEDLDPEARKAMRRAFDAAYLNEPFIEAIYRALYAHLTRKAPVTVWRVQPEGFPFEDFEAINVATARAGHWLAQDIEVSIRKTEVPES